ncbi:MAG TPA: hypothetical protein VFR94_17575 [Nitrososphaeraceae archaeon]|nr:hypothetical protein [Nitrososphaeraceae archaeon]
MIAIKVLLFIQDFIILYDDERGSSIRSKKLIKIHSLAISDITGVITSNRNDLSNNARDKAPPLPPPATFSVEKRNTGGALSMVREENLS